MKAHLLACVLVGLFLLPGWVRAQIKLPVFEEESSALKKVVFEEAGQREDFRNGKLMRVTLAGTPEKTVKGILVRVDKQKRRIFLRTEPGAAPLAVAEKDIKRIDKGVIKEVSSKQDYTEPEIRALVIMNGAKRTVSYNAPTLSPSEKSFLIRMEAAENEMARLEWLAEREERVLSTDMAIQTETLKTQALITRRQELLNFLLADMTERDAYLGNFRQIHTGQDYRPSASTQITALPSALRQGPTVFPGLTGAQESLAKSRESLALTLSRGVYEGDRLVAVVVEEQDK